MIIWILNTNSYIFPMDWFFLSHLLGDKITFLACAAWEHVHHPVSPSWLPICCHNSFYPWSKSHICFGQRAKTVPGRFFIDMKDSRSITLLEAHQFDQEIRNDRFMQRPEPRPRRCSEWMGWWSRRLKSGLARDCCVFLYTVKSTLKPAQSM